MFSFPGKAWRAAGKRPEYMLFSEGEMVEKAAAQIAIEDSVVMVSNT